MKMLYIECGNGISGDMSVGMLLDLGADPEKLKTQLKSLPLPGYEIEITRIKKSGLDCCDFAVKLDDKPMNHDHDTAYLYPGSEVHHRIDEEAPIAHHHHGDEDGHVAHHHHGDEDGHGAHHHRGLPEIREIIARSAISERAKKLSEDIFIILAEAEAKAHGTKIDQVHFHEVGAVDSIVDIVAFAVCFDDLGIDEVVIPALCEGHGNVRCQHGMMPIPVPAVVNIAAQKGLTLKCIDVEAELVTPTGAAIAAAVRTKDRLPGEYRIIRSGMGAGKRDYGLPSILRGMLIEEQKQSMSDKNEIIKSSENDLVCELEANLDDCMGEMLGYTFECLFEAGARDVYFTPIYMKKNRPAYKLSVICASDDASSMKEIIFRETTTIGIRESLIKRTILKRETMEVTTRLGKIKVKKCYHGTNVCVFPEYESVKELCKQLNKPYKEVWQTLNAELSGEYNEGEKGERWL